MREILYKYSNIGSYYTDDKTVFDDDGALRITVEPHDFSIAVGGEVLRKSSFGGCIAEASNDGSVDFYDVENNRIGGAPGCGRTFKQVKVSWKNGALSLEFGFVDVIDCYPNCDGESDRWDYRWVVEHVVPFDGAVSEAE